VNGFKVTEMEFETIRTLGEASRQFLVKQGHKSTVVTLDLSGLNEMLDVLSTSLDNVEILDEIRAEVGDNPQIWMPIYLDRLAQRKAVAKQNRVQVVK
jgi:type IV secretion system protein VirB4